MNFSIVCIAKNEEKTLPRLIKSLDEFQKRGGEIIVCDTGSTDNTVKIAKKLGCKVTEVGDRFIKTIKNADEINKRFIKGEKPIIKNGDKMFDFSASRNYASTLASNDMIATPDPDEVYTRLDLDKIEKIIKDGANQLEYNFVFSHDQYGGEAIKFRHCKFYNRKKLKWVNVIHEVLKGDAKRVFLDESIIKLEHFQQKKEERGNYLPGLALDCFENQDNDRNSHYFARELLWNNRPKSAIKEFKRHIKMNGWLAERGQSMIYIGDAHRMLSNERKAVEWYHRAFDLDACRREAPMRLARHYYEKGDAQRTACYCSMALEIPWNSFYANQRQHYTQEPHELLYWAEWQLGDKEKSKYHWERCLAYQPNNPKYIKDAKFYGLQFTGERVVPDKMENRPDTLKEHLERYNWAKPFTKGRKILDAACGTGYGKDIFEAKEYRGVDISQEAVDYATQHYGDGFSIQDLEKIELDYKPDIVVSFETIEHLKDPTKFLEWVRDNSKSFIFSIPINNPSPFHKVVYSEQQIKDLINKYFKDVVWWEQKGFMCGIAFPTKLPMVSIIIPTLGREEKLQRILKTIKEVSAYPNYEVIVKQDKFPPNNQGVPRLVKQGVAESKGELVMFLGDDCLPRKNFIVLAVMTMLEIPDGLVGLNDMYWHGEFATHWLASKKLLPMLDGEFFHTGYYHTGCDNELTERCRQVGKYVWAEEAKVYHDHPVQTGFKKEDWDETYRFAYRKDRMEHDRNLLQKRAKEIGFELKTNFTKPK